MIPEPDYNEDDHPGHFNGNNRPSRDNDNNNENANHSVTMDEDGLVIPRKPINPTKESIEYRAMHRELKFCQKSYVFISIFIYSHTSHMYTCAHTHTNAYTPTHPHTHTPTRTISLSLSLFWNNNSLAHFCSNERYSPSSTKNYLTRDLCYRSRRRLDPLCSKLFEICNRKKLKKSSFGISPIM